MKDNADGVVFFFSMVDRSSFEDIPQQMARILGDQSTNLSKLVIATKSVPSSLYLMSLDRGARLCYYCCLGSTSTVRVRYHRERCSSSRVSTAYPLSAFLTLHWDQRTRWPTISAPRRLYSTACVSGSGIGISRRLAWSSNLPPPLPTHYISTTLGPHTIVTHVTAQHWTLILLKYL